MIFGLWWSPLLCKCKDTAEGPGRSPNSLLCVRPWGNRSPSQASTLSPTRRSAPSGPGSPSCGKSHNRRVGALSANGPAHVTESLLLPFWQSPCSFHVYITECFKHEEKKF